MGGRFLIPKELIEKENSREFHALEEDYDHLGRRLSRSRLDIEMLTARAQGFRVALPSWATATGGTRFGTFAGRGEPRDVFEKLDDCATVHHLVRCTDAVSLHIPWDRPDSVPALKKHARELGLSFDAMNSNTFQDQPGQKKSYRFGSLCHTDAATRQQAVAHNIECVRLGEKLGSKALSVWIADGSNFPGQQDFKQALVRYRKSLAAIYRELPADWRLFIEYKCYEPAFYSTVNNDWGTSLLCAQALGKKASILVDLGHHAPNVNIEMVVARLVQAGRLGGFHFNDSKYGDDDLDSGSIKPFQLFLIFCELTHPDNAKYSGFNPCYMIDQSHNVTDPLESLMVSAMEIQRAFLASLLVDRAALNRAQENNDAILAHSILKEAFQTDLSPILRMARYRSGGAIAPIKAYRAGGYRGRKGRERK